MNKFNIKINLLLLALLSLINGNLLLADNIGCRQTADIDSNGNKLAEWTIAVYMGARNNLASYAAGNLQDMANSARNDKINVVAQWDQSGKKGAWRYSAKNGIVNLENYSNVSNPVDIGGKIISFMEWVNLKYPSKKTALIFWNHGSGPISAKFGDPMRVFMQNREALSNPTISSNEFFDNCKVISELYSEELSQITPRDILFDDEYKTCLNNKDLRSTLLQLTSRNCLGKKLDLIGFDACFMGSTEIAYQLRDCADYMVGSPELELAKGWNYKNWILKLSQNPDRSSMNVAKDIVAGFEDLYKNKTQLFTQTAIDLSKIEEVNQSNLEIVKSFEESAKIFNKKIFNAVLKARKNCVQFSTKFYIDQHSFYKNMIIKILQEEGIAPTKEILDDSNLLLYDSTILTLKKYHPSIVSLIQNLKRGMIALEKTIIKSCNSNLFKEAGGLSIYFPSNKNIDSSYLENDYAKSSRWAYFLQNICSLMN